MKTAFAIVLWLSIGLGVLVGNLEQHNRPWPEKDGQVLLIVIMWPAIVTVEIYRAVLTEAT